MPHRALRPAPLVCAALAAILAPGCDPDCSSPGRIDGSYDTVARSTKDTWQISGFSTDGDVDEQLAQAELLAQLPLNGARTWALKYVPGDESYTLSIDDQRVIAKATPSDDNCNQLALSATGSFEGEAGSLHEFGLEADLLWTGDGLSGTFSYTDAWTWDGRSGEVRLPDGELLATLAE